MRLTIRLSIIFSLAAAPAGHCFVVSRGVSTAANPKRRSSLSKLYDKKKPVSASEQERREEGKRRKERKNDVVIGKTSAVPGENDFAIDPKKTEEEWMRQASDSEQEIFRLTELGLEKFKMLRLEEADDAFTRVFELKPHAYLWQAGIVRYLLDDLPRAAEIFAKSAVMVENRFGMASTEERIWRDACELKYLSKLTMEQRKALDGEGGIRAILEQPPPVNANDPKTPKENREVFRIARELFTASIKGDSDRMILSRAMLRSICGRPDANLKTLKADRKFWVLLGWYYLGLHYDALGETDEAKECMKAALRLCPRDISDDLTERLPILHMTSRGWIDGDQTGEVDDEETSSKVDNEETSNDEVLLNTIRDGVSKMEAKQVQDALKARSLAITGTDEELQQMLVAALVEDLSLEL